MLKTAFLIIVLFLFCNAAYSQSATAPAPALGPTPAPTPAPATSIEEVYLAKDNGEGKAGEQATEFRTTDIPIYCVVLLDTNSATIVKMNFVAVSVSGVKAETKVVTASYTTRDGQNRVNFTGHPDGKWTPGKYRVDLFLDGKPAKKLEFEIKGVGGNTSASKFVQTPDPPKSKPVKRPVKNSP